MPESHKLGLLDVPVDGTEPQAQPEEASQKVGRAVFSAPLIGFQLGEIVHVPDPSIWAVQPESWDALKESVERATPEGMTPQAHFASRLRAIGQLSSAPRPPQE